jgi:GT2 family glycosyltransferase
VSAAPELARVVVPVHDGFETLGPCLASVAATLTHDVEVELVDDASRDARVAELLTRAADRPGWRVERQPRNLGFVATVNAAFARTRGDVLLLNSDTVVTQGWYQRITDCARSDRRIATVTPFSNNAEICSLPEFCRANPMPEDPERVALAVRASGAPDYPELPTAVGFCMLVRRAALEAIGDFDAATFGAGYGEENDFCVRAKAHGWRNVLCDDAYVAHVGGQSFGALGQAPGGENLARLLARYPHYNAMVAAFIAADPLAPRRARIAALLAQPTGSAP